jgi:glycogen(starch) synthase
MHVLQLGPYPPPHGGVQTHLVALRDFLRRQGIRCSVVNLTRHRRLAEDDVHYPKTSADVARLLFRIPADIVHLQFGGHLSPRLLALAALASSLPGRKTVLTFHSGGYPRSPTGRSAQPFSIRGLILRRLDRVIGVNQELVDLFVRFGMPRERVRLIPPHGIANAAPASQLPGTLAGFFTTHDPVLVSVSGLEPEYDLSTQIAALGILRERYPRAGLILIGSGSLAEALIVHIGRTAFAEHVFLSGDVPHTVALRAIADGTVFLRTTLYDGDAISVREALHLGTPVVATDTAPRPPEVTLVCPRDPKGLADAIGRRLATGPVKTTGVPLDDSPLAAVLALYEELVPVRRACAPSPFSTSSIPAPMRESTVGRAHARPQACIPDGDAGGSQTSCGASAH